MDTIDVSNLNRQFLFRKDHVGKSKSLIAKESVLKLSHNGRPGKILSKFFITRSHTGVLGKSGRKKNAENILITFFFSHN